MRKLSRLLVRNTVTMVSHPVTPGKIAMSCKSSPRGSSRIIIMGAVMAENPPNRDPASQGPACKGPSLDPASRGTVAKAAGFRGLAILEAAIRETTRKINTRLARQGFRVTRNS